MALIDFTGRILFLSGDPQIIERQFAGEDIALVDAGALRDDVSTDEITPGHVMTVWDERLGRVPYVGFAAGGRNPIGIDAVKNGGFSVTVAGKRYGKGSSREHSPFAERSAGIRLVIAESFERIYRQNADNIGLFTSTDFSLVERLQSGESIDLEELVASRDALAAAILRHGGLLHYGRERMRHISLPDSRGDSGPRTLTEKILARHLVVTEDADATKLAPGTGAFVRARLALHARGLHRHVRPHAAQRLRPPSDAARAAGHPRVRGPHVLYPSQSRAHQPRVDSCHEPLRRRAPTIRGRLRPA